MNNMIIKENKQIGEKYYKINHKSGLEIYVIPKELTTGYALFGTRYGSADNCFRVNGEAEYTHVPDGIAHFLEHKMFENEDGVDTFVRYAQTGASANAYTSFTKTAYLFSCTDNFTESLEILLDHVTHPYFTPETVSKEQGIIGQEIRMYDDNPGWVLMMGLLQSLYKNNTVRVDIAGTVESISEITADLLYKCYNTFYNLHNMSLCVCGSITPEEVIEVADRMLTEAPAIEIDSISGEEEPQVYRSRFSAKMQVSKPQFAIGVKDTAISPDGNERMKKSAALSIICEMLFSRSGALFNELYSKQLIGSGLGYEADHNKRFSFIMLSGDSNDPEAVFARFVDYMNEVKAKGVEDEAFERAKRVVYAQLVKSFDSTEEIANNFLNYIFDDSDMLDYSDAISSVTKDDVSKLIADIFREDRYTLATVLPLDE
ncbi:MAG: insulinase family protein [Clostridia bacterium]|nr:insulinase family protein [Clostridia bacterium]